MKNLTGILQYFSIIIGVINNPSTLYSQSLETIKNTFDEDSVNILSKIFPNFFDDQTTPEYSGLYDLLYFNKIQEKEIDLSNLQFERISISLANKMTDVEKLDLSNNCNLKLNEEWFTYFFDNLKELSLNNCNLTIENLEVLNEMKSLERLNLSGNIEINIKILQPILANLKHLDVSYSRFDSSELEFILENASKLESLNFSRNDLFKQINLLNTLLKRPSLRILKLAKCGLEFHDFKNIVRIQNLEEIDLSNNYLSQLDQELFCNPTELQIGELNENITTDHIQGKEEKRELDSNGNSIDKELNRNITTNPNQGIEKRELDSNGNSIDKELNENITANPNQEIEKRELNENITTSLNQGITSKLKKINFSHSYLENEKFIKSLFDIEGLEVLNLKGSAIDFDMKEIFSCKAKNTLKELNVAFCEIKSPVTLKALTDFKNLEKLDLSGNTLNRLPNNFSFGQSKYSLKDLNISSCDLSKIGLKSLTEFTCLEKLNLSWISFGNIMPFGLNVGDLKNTLKELDLRGSNINNLWFELFMECTRLEKINFSGNCLSFLSKEFSMGCSKETLKEIDLGCTELNNEILFDITDCPKLQILNVSNNDSGKIPLDFRFGRSKDSLKELYMDNSNLNSNGLVAISECKKIEKLWINRNNFSDLKENFSFGLLERSLRELNLFDSNINYHCLVAISNCQKLGKLNIRGNEILNTTDIKVTNIIEILRHTVNDFLISQ